MAASTYPYDARDPNLRWCERCESRVIVTAMCNKHPKVCMTCESRAGGICEQGKKKYRLAPYGSGRVHVAELGCRNNPAADLYDYGESERREQR